MRTEPLAALPAVLALALAGCDVARPVAQGNQNGGQNCTACHGTQTPNHDFAANPELAAPDDTHQPHLVGEVFSAGFECSSCHVVPTDLSHLDGQVPVVLSGLAAQGMTNAEYSGGTCATYCHGATITTPAPRSPQWTATAIACNGCHGVPPATGLHTAIAQHASSPCASCHIGYVAATTTNLAFHVDGARNVVFLKKNPAVPGETYTFTAGWTACQECHDNNAAHP
jgi:predicted CxxxxCH...CXXCH cytochrome family protein